jgi:hypothetical protein
MVTVRFAWSPQLIDVRREQCPRAKWDRTARAWTMTEAEAERFLQASHNRLNLIRDHGEIHIDEACWIIGFVQGAPCVREAEQVCGPAVWLQTK